MPAEPSATVPVPDDDAAHRQRDGDHHPGDGGARPAGDGRPRGQGDGDEAQVRAASPADGLRRAVERRPRPADRFGATPAAPGRAAPTR
ncbi:hypothetical protein CXF43_11205 [Corynebacterium bovis]|nr:hypothetical protein CXF40_11130 [Corynebacterium bovis]RRO98861.1 hypothetical protein CXF41_11165 [Corynebacterium bovis]RRQ05830.1 hypothetical protein CXF43_11205 [Corynebacterium bovis]RRQ08572.1 hypothetical protein CXF44_11160 [Corynebacterium bovis]